MKTVCDLLGTVNIFVLVCQNKNEKQHISTSTHEHRIINFVEKTRLQCVVQSQSSLKSLSN
jgi:hypothetical protein